MPVMCLSGCLPEQHNAVVNLDLTSAAAAPGGGALADFTAWPEYHNGVAAGKLPCCSLLPVYSGRVEQHGSVCSSSSTMRWPVWT